MPGPTIDRSMTSVLAAFFFPHSFYFLWAWWLLDCINLGLLSIEIRQPPTDWRFRIAFLFQHLHYDDKWHWHAWVGNHYVLCCHQALLSTSLRGSVLLSLQGAEWSCHVFNWTCGLFLLGVSLCLSCSWDGDTWLLLVSVSKLLYWYWKNDALHDILICEWFTHNFIYSMDLPDRRICIRRELCCKHAHSHSLLPHTDVNTMCTHTPCWHTHALMCLYCTDRTHSYGWCVCVSTGSSILHFSGWVLIPLPLICSSSISVRSVHIWKIFFSSWGLWRSQERMVPDTQTPRWWFIM